MKYLFSVFTAFYSEVKNFSRRLLNPRQLVNVFTPTSIAQDNYITRPLLETDLFKYLSINGKQILLYGSSGSGKSTIIKHTLNLIGQKVIATPCESITKYEHILIACFDELDKYYISEISTNATSKVSASLKNEYASLKSSMAHSENVVKTRIVTPQLTPKKLAKFLGEINAVWLIEDFHKMGKTERQRLSDAMKIFVDAASDYPKLKIICIGTGKNINELIDFDTDLKDKIAQVLVPLLNDKEINRLVKDGFSLMNLDINTKTVDKIVSYSNNLASIAHNLCYELCFLNGKKEEKFFKEFVNEDKLKDAIDAYVREKNETFSQLFDLLLKEPYGEKILDILCENEYVKSDKILDLVSPQKKVSIDQLHETLSKFNSYQFGEIVRFDKVSNLYSFTTPFFKAYAKMRLMIEKKDITKQRKIVKEKLIEAFEEELNNEIILDDKFISKYYQYLDTYVTKKIQLQDYLFKEIEIYVNELIDRDPTKIK